MLENMVVGERDSHLFQSKILSGKFCKWGLECGMVGFHSTMRVRRRWNAKYPFAF
jgi:hypothetical protein